MAARRWPWRRATVPAILVGVLQADEQIQVVASLADGNSLAVSRFGLWMLSDQEATRWNWEHVSKAKLTGRTLLVVVAVELHVTDDGMVLMQDLPPREFELSGTSALTDAVHARVRRSVAASRYLPWPGAGGWVVLRRVPGRDGLTRQLRLDRYADPAADGFLSAAADAATELALTLRTDWSDNSTTS